MTMPGRSRLAGLTGLLLVASTMSAHAEDAVLACEGPFAADSSEARLVAAFGKANVAFEEVDGPEGTKEMATVVFGKDPKRRLTVRWDEEKKRQRPLHIELGPAWRLANGLRRELSLAEVEALNGRPFALSGFEWDFGGYVTDWKKGRLERLPGGCNAIVGFGPDEAAPSTARDTVSGDATFASDSKAMRAVKPRVGIISVGYPAKPGT
jgi:hypothetical protein